MSCALATLLLWETLCDQQAAVLLEQLGDERFQVREAATLHLVSMVRADNGHSMLTRVQHALKSPDPEVVRRAEGVIAEYFNLRPTKAFLVPWIDMLPETVKDRQSVIQEYCRRGHEAGFPSGSPRWANYRYATSLYVTDLLRAGTPRHQIQKLLDDMAMLEKQYKAKQQPPLPDDY